MSSKILQELSELLSDYSKYEDYTKTRSEASRYAGQVITVDGDKCPSGTVVCDPTKEDCPSDEVALQPAIYTSKGRCYSKVNVNEVRRNKKDVMSERVMLMNFVEKAAKLSAEVQGKLKEVTCPQLSSKDLCGMKNQFNWSNNKCLAK